MGYLQILKSFIDLVFLRNKSNFRIFANIAKFSCRTRVILGYLQILKSFIDLVSCGTRGDKSGEVPTGLASLPPYTPAP